MEKFLPNTSQQLELNNKISNSTFAEMVLSKAIHDFRKEQILKGIDRSLQYRNKAEFLRLTEELKKFSQ